MQQIRAHALRAIDAVCALFGQEAERWRARLPKVQKTGGDAYYPVEAERYARVLETLKKPALVAALDLCVAQFLYPSFYHLLKKLSGQGTTLALAYRISATEEPDYLSVRDDYERLRLYLPVEKQAENMLYTELYADAGLVLFLAGEDALPSALLDCAELFCAMDSVEHCFGMESWLSVLRAQFERLNEKEERCLLQLRAGEGRGCRTLIKSLAEQDGAEWLFLDYRALPKSEKNGKNGAKPLAEKLWFLRREVRLRGAGLCVHHVLEQNERELAQFFSQEAFLTLQSPYPICICTAPDLHLAAYLPKPVLALDLKEASRAERVAVWRGFAERFHLPIDAEDCGVRYRLNPADIEKLCRMLAAMDLPSDAAELGRVLARLCVEVRGMPKSGTLGKMDFPYSMEDLKLEQAPKRLLLSIANHVRHSRRVYDDWEMEQKYPYGKAITALFSGPPGTGKTMAANVLSGMLGLPLYRIDLSQVIDKYIGETEKKLEEAFAYAERSNVILFFDEADALFGKRTEVKDSKDKYANNEVAYLLQRIERYEGLVILATNLRNNIDEAFMRRMRYAVEFRLPDVAARREIWVSGFSEAVPLSDVDFDLLARKVELSGGYIRNIILNAAFSAAAENSPVTMHHLIESICDEYEKLGKHISAFEFAQT